MVGARPIVRRLVLMCAQKVAKGFSQIMARSLSGTLPFLYDDPSGDVVLLLDKDEH